MKKTLMIGVMVSLLLCISGCGKKLTCTGDMLGMDANVVTKFDKDDKSKSVSMTLVMDVKEYFDLEEDPSKDDMKDYEEKIKEEFEEMEDYDNVKVSSKGSKITVKCSYDIEKENATDYEKTKEDMENIGLTCK